MTGTDQAAANGPERTRATKPILCYQVDALPPIDKPFYARLADAPDGQRPLISELVIPPRSGSPGHGTMRGGPRACVRTSMPAPAPLQRAPSSSLCARPAGTAALGRSRRASCSASCAPTGPRWQTSTFGRCTTPRSGFTPARHGSSTPAISPPLTGQHKGPQAPSVPTQQRVRCAAQARRAQSTHMPHPGWAS